MSEARIPVRWALLWRSCNALDGNTSHVMWHHCQPLLFDRKTDAIAWACEHYGYIAKRPDLRCEPHGWRTPKPVRVQVDLRVVSV